MADRQELTVAVPHRRVSLRKIVIALLLLTAFAHVPVAVQHVHESPSLAVAFVVLILAAAACAAALAAADRLVVWAAAAALSGATVAAYVGSRTIGFPGRPDDTGDWEIRLAASPWPPRPGSSPFPVSPCGQAGQPMTDIRAGPQPHVGRLRGLRICIR